MKKTISILTIALFLTSFMFVGREWGQVKYMDNCPKKWTIRN